MVMCLWHLFLANTKAELVTVPMRKSRLCSSCDSRCWECPLETGEVINSPWWWPWPTTVFSMALEVLSHMLPDRALNPCPSAHQCTAGNSIYAWQHQPNNHLLATRVLCPRRNLEVSAVVTHFLEGNQLFPHLFSNSKSPTSLSLCFSHPNTSFQLAELFWESFLGWK